MEISFIVKQQSISVVIRSEQWKKFMWNTVESVLKSANPPNISWVHIHGSVKSSDLQQIMERTKQHSTRACPNTQEPVSQDWSQLYICIYRRRGIVRLLAETNLSERYNHDKTETTSAGCNVRSAVRQLDSFYTADHLTLTTQMMAGERNDSQTGHALAQGPLATDIMAASSATLWISSTVCRAVEDQKPGPNRPRWNAFQMTVLTSDPVPGGEWRMPRDWWPVGETWPVLRRPVGDVAVVEGPAELQGPAASNQAGQHKPVPFQHHLLPRSAASQVGSHLWHKERIVMCYFLWKG